MSKFYIIGVGVGDKENITLKAVETLKKLDILYCPTSKSDNESIAYLIAKNYLKNDTKIKNRHFPMVRYTKELENVFEEISNEIKQDVKSGKNVGFVTIGDPMLYSTSIYILKKLKDEIDIVTISGVPAFVDVASKVNFPVAFDDMPFIVLPATMEKEKMEEYLQNYEAIVIMKAYKNYDDIINLIKKYSLQDHTLIVSNSSRDKEKIIIKEQIFKEKNNEYLTTILINKRWSL